MTPETFIPAHPFRLELDPLHRMLNLELADDPVYSGLEIQHFDDDRHGTGFLVFLLRTADGTCDVYVEPGVDVERSNYAIGRGLGSWTETEFDEAVLDISPRGVRAALRFTDIEGRAIEAEIGDRTSSARRTAAFLAPMGADVANPRALPMVWMSEFDLLRRSGPEPLIRIDGREAATGHLPLEPLLRRRLIKVASGLVVVSLNPALDEPTPLTDVPATQETIEQDGGVRAVTASASGHEARLEMDPPFPALRPGAPPASGTWAVTIAGSHVAGGTWDLSLGEAGHDVRFDVTQGWNPRGLPPLMSVVTRVAPVFRTWPTTYRWEASVEYDESPAVTSRWVRTTGQRAESYRALTQRR